MSAILSDSFALPALTEKKRREVCVREAARAVIGALGGLFVYSVEVAPLGSTEWTATGRKVGVLTGLWGIARTSDLWFPGMPQWDEFEGCMRIDQAAFRAHLAELGAHLGVVPSRFYQRMRAQLCTWLAGPVADEIVAAEEPPYYLESTSWGPDDVAVAEAWCRLLPGHDAVEREHAALVTFEALCEHWPRVLALADVLEAAGLVEDDDILAEILPRARYGAWPSSPRSKARKSLRCARS